MGRILIIGGGVAGAAAALAVRKAGWDPVVYERHPDNAEDLGAFLTLAANGHAALDQLDAAEAVGRAGFALHTLEFAGRTKALERTRCLRRGELCRVLQGQVVRRGIPVHHGRRLIDATEDSSGVTARFADGETVRGDLLLGADGLHSTVRELLNPGVAPRYAGQRVFYGYSRLAEPPAEPGRIVMVRGGAAFGYAVSPGGEVYWFARVTSDPLPEGTVPDPAWLLALLRPDGTECAGIVEATQGPLLATNARDLANVPRWRGERILLLGDAAHAASPATGQGASMALEDAVVLGKALRDTGFPLEAYERLRRPRVEYNTAASARMSAGLPVAGTPPVDEEELARQLDWATALASS
ncbi:2-polyprenyl-6-methoxyphenol hydroxylase [Amycolatopsis sacchari]|uniref:2-polyprenyl-6-methoxyphenol hydroxylase n=1 Tax=Amycolatopsis sacchari TaxID=115433 RepID=A0A1I3KM42_9PSEU|nr:FAD-dependent monooxygenase [Amycolatopsis sacchari]SFI73559.1 2-polyprenyl-6-methoxyphenol hydroxylase [Amycolatopsis sacchari]